MWLKSITTCTGVPVTLENHTVVGGLFETVASEALRRGLRRQVTPIALPDEFLAAGALPTLHDRYGLSTARRRRGTRPAVA
jgi:transketolase